MILASTLSVLFIHFTTNALPGYVSALSSARVNVATLQTEFASSSVPVHEASENAGSAAQEVPLPIWKRVWVGAPQEQMQLANYPYLRAATKLQDNASA